MAISFFGVSRGIPTGTAVAKRPERRGRVNAEAPGEHPLGARSLLFPDTPTQAFPQTAAHDPFEIVGRQEIQGLREMRDALPIGAMLQHARQVGPPKAAPRTERLD